MAEFRQGVLTTAGTNLLARAQAGEITIEFTTFQIGDGEWASDISDATLMATAELLSSKAEFGISKAEYINDSTTQLTLVASNDDNTAGFYVTEVGVFAQAKGTSSPILYAVYVTEEDKADWFPAYNSITPTSLTYTCPISVANAAEVTINVNSGGVATQADLDALAERVDALELTSAICIGIKRMCQADGTPQSSTAWTRWGTYTDVTVEYARGTESVQNDLMSKWPYNRLRPCNLPLGSEDPVAYLGDADFDWYGAAGNAAGTSVMLEVPTDMYMARWYEVDDDGQNWEYKCVADTPRYPNSVYVRDLMARSDGTTKKYFYFPIFLGSINDDGNFVSVAGAAPAIRKSCTTMRTAALTNGGNWQLVDVWAWEILSDLAEIMSADANFKTTYGLGCSSFGAATSSYAQPLVDATATNVVTIASSKGSLFRVGMTVNIASSVAYDVSIAQDRTITAIADSTEVDDAVELTLDGDAFDITTECSVWRGAQITGATIDMVSPNGTAGANDGCHSVRMLYIEDFYGMLHTGVDGMNLKFNEDDMCLEMYVCNDPANYSDAYDGYTLLPGTLALYADNSNYDYSGYIKKEYYFENYPLLEMPEAVANGAGSATYLAAYINKNKNGQRPFFGGAFNVGGYVSPRYRGCLNAFSTSFWACGSRPLRR